MTNDINWELVNRCRLMCGAEAELANLPYELGIEIHDGIVRDDVERWSEEQYLNWCKELDHKWAQYEQSQLTELYLSISKLMGDYGVYMINQ